MKKIFYFFLLIILLFSLFGCGSSSNTPQTATIKSTAALDGFITPSYLDNTNYLLSVGDDSATNEAYQSLLSFDLSGLSGAIIESAVLRLYLSTTYNDGVNETDPYPSLGSVLVEHLHTDYGTLGTEDYANPAGLTSIGTLSSARLPIPDWRTLVVTTSVGEDIGASRTKSQFRLYRAIATDNDNLHDTDYYWSGDIPTFNQPELVITYR